MDATTTPRRLDDRVFPIYEVDGKRRIGSAPVFATLAESLIRNARLEVEGTRPTMTDQEKLYLLGLAADIAASVASAVDYDQGPDHPVYVLTQEALVLRDRARRAQGAIR